MRDWLDLLLTFIAIVAITLGVTLSASEIKKVPELESSGRTVLCELIGPGVARCHGKRTCIINYDTISCRKAPDVHEDK